MYYQVRTAVLRLDHLSDRQNTDVVAMDKNFSERYLSVIKWSHFFVTGSELFKISFTFIIFSAVQSVIG